jgi:hypothetical protein
MKNFIFKTPEELFEIEKKAGLSHYSLSNLKRMAKDDRICEVCDQPVWKYGGTGLCFSCTTGESDASSDYELKE